MNPYTTNTKPLTEAQIAIAQHNVANSPCFAFNPVTEKIERIRTPERIPSMMERMMSKFPMIDHWKWHLLGARIERSILFLE